MDVPKWRAPHPGAALALILSLGAPACRDHPRATPPRPLPAPSAQVPVNPDPGVTRYVCADGQAVTAGYPDGETAVVTYKDHAYTLKLARSANGARYTGYGLQWWTRGDRASLAELKGGEDLASGPGLDCQAPPRSPSGDSVTRTAFTRDR